MCLNVLAGFMRRQRKVCVPVVTQIVSRVMDRALMTVTRAPILRAPCAAGRVFQPVRHKLTETAGLGGVWVSRNTKTHEI